MPFSQSSQLSAIIGFIERLKPSSILDVGAGMGQYGFLARTNLESINLFEVDGCQAEQRHKNEWKVVIDAIEGCSIYHTPIHDYVYNHVFWDDAMKILPKLNNNSYELVLAIDILEHFHKEEGLLFLSELKRISSKSVLISTPKEFCHQEIEANPYENHRSLWNEDELKVLGFNNELSNNESWVMVFED